MKCVVFRFKYTRFPNSLFAVSLCCIGRDDAVLQIHSIAQLITLHIAHCLLKSIVYHLFMRNLLTHSMSQGPSEAGGSSAGRENSPHFVERGSSLPCSQESATCHCPDPGQSGQHPSPVLSLQHSF